MDGGDHTRLSMVNRSSIAGSLVLVAVVALVFWRVAGFEFLIYDDDRYFTGNPAVHQGLTPDSVRWAFTTFHEGMYQPVTWLSHLTEISVFGLDPGPMHVVNLLLHLCTSLLLWRVLWRSTGSGRAAFVVALLFAVHPLQVQSVAWLSERKGLLAALFGLVALDQWVSHVQRPGGRAGLWAHGAFALSLLAKPVWLPLPFLLLLLDRWPLERPVQGREKRWMFLIALAGGALASFAQAAAHALSTVSEVGILPRLANAVLAWGFTLRRLVAPFDLAAFYPFRFDHGWGWVFAWAVVLVAGSVAAWRLRRRRPAWFTGWYWWLLLQAPTVGLLQFGSQGTADRFSYLPLIGLLLMLVYGLRWQGRTAVVTATLAVLACGVQSSRALTPWRDTISLLEHSVSRSGGSALEHQNLSQAYLKRGDTMAAMRHSSRAVHYAPYSPTVLFRQADLLFMLGNYTDALERYREGLKFDDARAEAWAQVARLYALSKEWPLSSRAWFRALDLDPQNVVYVMGLATGMRAQGLEEEELALYQRAVTLAPSIPGVRSEMAWIHATSEDLRLRDPAIALRLAETDLRLSEGESARALEVQAAALAALGETDRARSISVAAEAKAVELGEPDLAAQIRERRGQYLRGDE